MPRVIQIRKDGTPVRGLYGKIGTEADVFRFVSAESGHTQVIHRQDDTILPDGRSRVTIGPLHPSPNNTPSYIEYVLEFQYFVGLNHLQVLYNHPACGTFGSILGRTVIDRARQAWAGWESPPYDGDLDPDNITLMHFQEVSPDVVRVMNPGIYKIFAFAVPHTSLQAVSRNRISVENQGDNRAIELLGQNDGIVFTSPNGRKGLLRIDDNLHIGVDSI